ncbi:PH domain-containing protein [Nocardia rosealba]|uniref:PH domain-containing protein n=1 Tax=Nocardia TaxID=1817 RepID=UPI001CDA4D3C|nr:PH domain-containing protein [Nocardia rosealba]MCA2205876.1 PH domain-containing protein [Nocardia rosealba]
MADVRAGVVPASRSLFYCLIGLLVTIGIAGLLVAMFGANRVVTGVLVGAVGGVAAGVALFVRDVVELTEHGIYVRTPFRSATVPWDRVVAGRFTLDEHGRWALALDLTENGDELVLLSIPPVMGPVSGAYDMRKREQVTEIREMLRAKRIPITVLPGIAAALNEHWQIAPPTSR